MAEPGAALAPERLLRVLADHGVDYVLIGCVGVQAGIELGNPGHLYAGGNFAMRTLPGDLDVFAIDQTAGAPRSYEELRARAVGRRCSE
jgi:hypothetical protein